MLEIINWQNSAGEKIHFQSWIPEKQPKAIIVLIHGLGEHCNRYQHVAGFFNNHDMAVFALDHLGHGESEGKRGHIPSFSKVAEYTNALINVAQEKFPKTPVFLYGHSMGGNMVLTYTLREDTPLKISGVICTSPGLGVGQPLPFSKLLGLKIFKSLIPSLTMENGLDLENLTHSKEVIQAYKDDPLVHPMISTKLANDMMKQGDWVILNSEKFPVPIYLIQGEKDHIVSLEKTKAFANGVPQDKIRFTIYEGLFHELHNEPQQMDVLNDMVSWVEEQLQ